MAKSLTSYSRNRKATSKLSDVASSRPNVVVECNQKPIFGFDMVGGCTALSLSVPQKVGEAWLNVDPIGYSCSRNLASVTKSYGNIPDDSG